MNFRVYLSLLTTLFCTTVITTSLLFPSIARAKSLCTRNDPTCAHKLSFRFKITPPLIPLPPVSKDGKTFASLARIFSVLDFLEPSCFASSPEAMKVYEESIKIWLAENSGIQDNPTLAPIVKNLQAALSQPNVHNDKEAYTRLVGHYTELLEQMNGAYPNSVDPVHLQNSQNYHDSLGTGSSPDAKKAQLKHYAALTQSYVSHLEQVAPPEVKQLLLAYRDRIAQFRELGEAPKISAADQSYVDLMHAYAFLMDPNGELEDFHGLVAQLHTVNQLGQSEEPCLIDPPKTQGNAATQPNPSKQKINPQGAALVGSNANINGVSAVGCPPSADPNMFPLGSAFLTAPGDLSKNGIRGIIHAASGSSLDVSNGGNPAYGPTYTSVENSVTNSMLLAQQAGFKSISIPLIGGSIFLSRIPGGTKEKLAEAIVKSALTNANGIGLVQFLGVDATSANTFAAALKKVRNENPKLAGVNAVVVQGSIVAQKTDAIVNAANTEGRFGGGVSGAIGKATKQSAAIDAQADHLKALFYNPAPVKAPPQPAPYQQKLGLNPAAQPPTGAPAQKKAKTKAQPAEPKKAAPIVVPPSAPNAFGPTNPNAQANVGRDAAGALVYTRRNGKIYVLLGKEKYGKEAGRWCMMLGKTDHPGESYAQAAARELYEETAGLIRVHHKALAKKSYSVQTDPNKNNLEQAWRQTYTFFVETKYRPAKDFKYAADHHPKTDFSEMSDYAWVPLNDIQNTAKKGGTTLHTNTLDEGPQTIQLRGIAAKILRESMKQGDLIKIQ